MSATIQLERDMFDSMRTNTGEKHKQELTPDRLQKDQVLEKSEGSQDRSDKSLITGDLLVC